MYTRYLNEIVKTCSQLPLEQIEHAAKRLSEARANKKWVYLFGNGGSAANASHLANGLQKARTKAHVLDCVPIITAIGNDSSYNRIFVEQLADVIETGDVVIGISCSGNSQNVISAAVYARPVRAVTLIGLTAFDGGRLREIADIPLHAPVDSYEQAEDVHSIIGHMITLRLLEL